MHQVSGLRHLSMTYHSSGVLELLETLGDRPEEAGRAVDKYKYSCYTLEIACRCSAIAQSLETRRNSCFFCRRSVDFNMKIEWVPLRVPLERRLQTLATAFFTYTFFTLPITSCLAVAILLYYGGLIIRTLLLLYFVKIYVDYKKNCAVVEGNGWLFYRSIRRYRDYFPVELVKTAELPANKNYIVASFPHGILGTGTCINMSLDIEKWLELFPQVRPKIATLDHHFRTPFLRDILRWWGMVSVSKESLAYLLSKSNDPKHKDNRDGFTSNAVAVLVGGAQEAMETHPGKYILTLRNRKGFVKMAIRTGSSIVPSLSFGEVDIFDQVANPPDSALRRFQNVVKKFTGISPLLPKGRGIFNYNYGILPHRRRIVQVVGSPIDVIRSDSPDADYVDKIHAQVIEALEKMFEQYKEEYISDCQQSKLVIQ
ncbi:2-acylglycerol O-acyltransferase 2-A isoform X2 [Drosophila biarmipes]|uniref:2-acylglycerol O-acyltransferase 2-A isoform X2 n=1 Tax=Drosophila biarmipes TaxID=125945 RepID=UPI0007E70900|nr:2-acylglycerol O-acyltransferase 2-A isoform X2 [Drosophila biarmipes]